MSQTRATLQTLSQEERAELAVLLVLYNAAGHIVGGGQAEGIDGNFLGSWTIISLTSAREPFFYSSEPPHDAKIHINPFGVSEKDAQAALRRLASNTSDSALIREPREDEHAHVKGILYTLTDVGKIHLETRLAELGVTRLEPFTAPPEQHPVRRSRPLPPVAGTASSQEIKTAQKLILLYLNQVSGSPATKWQRQRILRELARQEHLYLQLPGTTQAREYDNILQCPVAAIDPALQALQDPKLAYILERESPSDSNIKEYSITDKGKAHVEGMLKHVESMPKEEHIPELPLRKSAALRAANPDVPPKRRAGGSPHAT